jgi:hypothetical protein
VIVGKIFGEQRYGRDPCLVAPQVFLLMQGMIVFPLPSDAGKLAHKVDR